MTHSEGKSRTTNGGSHKPPDDTESPAITKMEMARAQLKSVSDADEDTGKIEIPQDAPPRAKVLLGFSSGLTPNGRLILALALVATLAMTLWKFGAVLLPGVK